MPLGRILNAHAALIHSRDAVFAFFLGALMEIVAAGATRHFRARILRVAVLAHSGVTSVLKRHVMGRSYHLRATPMEHAVNAPRMKIVHGAWRALFVRIKRMSRVAQCARLRPIASSALGHVRTPPQCSLLLP